MACPRARGAPCWTGQRPILQEQRTRKPGFSSMCAMRRDAWFAVLLSATVIHAANNVDPSTLEGKVLFGYQGWFNCPGDGSPRPTWSSGARGVPSADTLTIELYPDLR